MTKAGINNKFDNIAREQKTADFLNKIKTRAFSFGLKQLTPTANRITEI